ncbi:DNA replication and repair protein RecO [Sphingobacterium allocomposti]|jgi:DNA repair protein RecO (recombination protein O)|uniref:DNA repair protein RecO n=1 Tax=Sphingobacterium allocomposti TaxID=415956 RepID=A0A5S5D8G1_9SPHI|nr:DNA repair protein RecO [Sphingobacterium composti Yoo et al. 2007 non Ten et al. 2007]TYP91764.1 DNA replication and repair protein RecO [Sphingobacterium composti Yoo et al. 2007 non Ten et al. 2007]HLS93938.1 DNA repair protein RecO [Sphingobacterium sp.]
MLHKTRGVALKTTNFSENSVVAHIFTETFGMQSYLVQGAKKSRAKISANLFQPLHPLDMVVYHKANNGLQRIKEVHQIPVLHHIPLDITKSALAIFLNEVLYKVLRQQSPDPALFNFIQQSVIWMDQTTTKLTNFHLVFLVRLSRFLGFLPLQAATRTLPFFNLLDGVFCNTLPSHSHILQEPHTSLFQQLLKANFEDSAEIKMGKEDRKYLLEKILEFYKLHTEAFGSVHSLYVLEEIFQ